MTFTGTTTFLENSPGTAAIWVFESFLHFNGTNNFIGKVNSVQSTSNTSGGSGAVYATTGSFLSFNGVSNFSNNSAHYGGGAIYADTALVANTTVSFNGMIFSSTTQQAMVAQSTHNIMYLGSLEAVFLMATQHVLYSGGAIYAATDTSLSFTGDNNFSNNSAYSGGAIRAEIREDGQCSKFGDILQYHLTINLTCPPGFNISEPTRSCVYEQRLETYTNSCNITSRKITRDSLQQFWVGYDDWTNSPRILPL